MYEGADMRRCRMGQENERKGGNMSKITNVSFNGYAKIRRG